MLQLVPNGLLDGFCMMAVYIVAIYNYICMKDNKRGTGWLFFVVFITLFSLFYRPANGDFWGYLSDYELGGDYQYRHMEPFYYWLMSLVPNNYLLWRVTVWLPAAILIVATYKLLDVPTSIATTFFLLLALTPSYYYTRNVLALAVLYLAMALVSRPGNHLRKWSEIVLFGGLVIASWFLHRSMPLYIALAVLSLLLPFEKKYLIAAVIAFPLLRGSIYIVSTNFLNIAQIWLTEGAGEYYLEEVNVLTANWKGIISLIIQYLPIFYFFVTAFRKPLPKTSSDFYPFKTFLLFAFFTVFLSFLFWGQGSDAIRGRLYKSAMLPFAFSVCIYFKNLKGTKQCKTFLLILLISILWHLFISATSSI